MSQIIAFIVILFLLALIYFFLSIHRQLVTLTQERENDRSQETLVEWLKTMQGSMDKNLGSMTETLQRQHQSLNERLDNAARVVGNVGKELGQMSEIGRQMRELQDLLRSPKMRGNLGEQVLRDLLEQVLPHNHFFLQYSFAGGKTVDAVIKTERGIIPIDSKFPMESFLRLGKVENEIERGREMRTFVRAVKKHIDDISQKYILPQEGTLDFALMYVPSEPLYYEMVMNESDINSYAHSRKVLLVSPNSFYYFLRIVLMGLQEKKIAEGAKQILATLDGIRQETSKFGEDLTVLAGHVGRTKNSMDSVVGKYQQLSGSIERVKYLTTDEEEIKLEAVAPD